MAKIYKLSQAQYRKKLRDEERLFKLKDIINQAHKIVRHIRRRGDKVSSTLPKQ